MSSQVNGEDAAGEPSGHPLIARLLGAGQRSRRWGADHRWVLDTAVVLLIVLIFCLPDLLDPRRTAAVLVSLAHRPLIEILLLQAGLVIPLWWRRRAPLLVFYAVTGVFVVQWAASMLLRADVALMVAIYSLVRYGRLKRLHWALPAWASAFAIMVARLSGVVPLVDVMFVALSAGTAAAALGLAARIRYAQLAVLRERATQLEIERDQRSKLAAATERTRVAREMHDIIGHSLSVIVTLADGGMYAADTAPERSKEALRLIGDTGRRSLGELRRMLGVLRDQADEPTLRPQPGIADIEPLCHRIRDAGPQVDYQSTGDLESLDPGVQLATYRIVQEALTNTLKYAGPQTRVHLALRVDGARLRIVVRDTGGSAPADRGGRAGEQRLRAGEERARAGAGEQRAGAGAGAGERGVRAGEQGHGLIGMRERAALYRGTVVAGPAPGGGWRVVADLDLTPLPPPEEDPA